MAMKTRVLSDRQNEAFLMLQEAEELGSGKWNTLTPGMHRDVARAWREYRLGNYDEAIATVRPPLSILQRMKEKYG